MKNQYVGDLNDFAKYQLLRLSALIFELVLVAWMLTADDGLGDGAKIGYLREPACGDADPELFDGLATLIGEKQRSIATIEAAGLLLSGFFAAEPVPLEVEERGPYFEAIAAQASESTLVFFDPDNGLEVASTPKHRRGAEKYLYLDELTPFRAIGSSLPNCISTSPESRDTFLDIERMRVRLERELGANDPTFAAHTSHVCFLFAVRDPYAAPLREALIAHCSGSPLLSFLGER